MDGVEGQGRSSYQSSVIAAMPRTIFYGSVLAGVHAWAAWVGFQGIVQPAAGVAAAVFLTVLGVTIGLAVYGYERRSYAFGSDAIIEQRWVLRQVQKDVAYEDIEDITVTQTWIQSLFDTATLRLNHIETETVGDEEDMRIRYAADPEAIYSELISRCAEYHDPIPRAAVDDQFDSYAVENATVFSGEQTATATGGTYLLPYAVINPRFRGILRAFGIHGLYLVSLLMAPVVYVMFVADLFTIHRLAGTWLLLYVGYLGYGYWTRGRIQYELYSEYVKTIDGTATRTVGYDDIETIEYTPGGFLHGNYGKVTGRDADGDTVVEIAYVTAPGDLAAGFATVADASRS